MIKKIQLKNFQGHKNTEVVLGSGINSFIGENDSGKTSLFRAIQLVRTNRPLGTGYIRKNQSEDSEVIIELGNSSITRKRGEKTNEYLISDIEEPFVAFGSNPPEEVVELLNLSDINIQSQLDQPFLVLSSPGQIAQHIRSISGLDIIDKVTTLLKSRISTKSTALDNQKELLEEKEKKLTELEKIDITKIEKLIQEAELLQKENEENIILSASLSKILREILDVEKTWIELPVDIDIVLNRTEQTCSVFQAYKYKIDSLNRLIDELVLLDKEILRIPADAENIILQVEPLEKQYNNIGSKINSLTKLIHELSEIETDEIEKDKTIQNKQEELFVLLNQITICPFCTSGLNKKTKKALLENY